jgi:hypothetical protein
MSKLSKLANSTSFDKSINAENFKKKFHSSLNLSGQFPLAFLHFFDYICKIQP